MSVVKTTRGLAAAASSAAAADPDGDEDGSRRVVLIHQLQRPPTRDGSAAATTGSSEEAAGAAPAAATLSPQRHANMGAVCVTPGPTASSPLQFYVPRSHISETAQMFPPLASSGCGDVDNDDVQRYIYDLVCQELKAGTYVPTPANIQIQHPCDRKLAERVAVLSLLASSSVGSDLPPSLWPMVLHAADTSLTELVKATYREENVVSTANLELPLDWANAQPYHRGAAAPPPPPPAGSAEFASPRKDRYASTATTNSKTRTGGRSSRRSLGQEGSPARAATAAHKVGASKDAPSMEWSVSVGAPEDEASSSPASHPPRSFGNSSSKDDLKPRHAGGGGNRAVMLRQPDDDPRDAHEAPAIVSSEQLPPRDDYFSRVVVARLVRQIECGILRLELIALRCAKELLQRQLATWRMVGPFARAKLIPVALRHFERDRPAVITKLTLAVIGSIAITGTNLDSSLHTGFVSRLMELVRSGIETERQGSLAAGFRRGAWLAAINALCTVAEDANGASLLAQRGALPASLLLLLETESRMITRDLFRRILETAGFARPEEEESNRSNDEQPQHRQRVTAAAANTSGSNDDNSTRGGSGEDRLPSTGAVGRTFGGVVTFDMIAETIPAFALVANSANAVDDNTVMRVIITYVNVLPDAFYVTLATTTNFFGVLRMLVSDPDRCSSVIAPAIIAVKRLFELASTDVLGATAPAVLDIAREIVRRASDEMQRHQLLTLEAAEATAWCLNVV